MATSSAQAGPSTPTSLGEGSSTLPPLPPPPPIPFRRPGKSILKEPPPPPAKFFSFSTLSKLLPSQSPNAAQPGNGLSNGDESKGIRGTPLKRAHFILPSLSTTYPIWSGNPPASPSLQQEKAEIEERERGRRARLVRGNSVTSFHSGRSVPQEDWWSIDKVEQFYKECCWGREEPIDPKVVTAVKAAGGSPRALDLTGIPFDLGAATALSDLLTIEWGLRRLTLKDCEFMDTTLKPILHTLLIPNSLLNLSLASNKQLKATGWRLVGVYLSKAVTLQFLDISQNNLDKRAVEYIAAALGTIPPSIPASSADTPTSIPSTPSIEFGFEPPLPKPDKPKLVTLRIDDCNLRYPALEVLAQAIRNSPVQHISLRNNRISSQSAVALAIMIKDYPDAISQYNISPASSPPPGSPVQGQSPTIPGATNHSRSLYGSSPAVSVVRQAVINQTAQATIQPGATTYTPYIPRAKRGSAVAVMSQQSSTERERQVPVISTSFGGGITTATRPAPLPNPNQPSPREVVNAAQAAARNAGPSAALLDKVRALDHLPRLGALKTLDLRGNELRNGVSYISQVLKRNRTLKILNLADNRVGVEGLVSIAEALKYNTTLETLDMSKNPCCGPGVEGITSLRTAFTLNTALKRLFLSNTSLTSTAAIMLAEFLPESTSLLHLDLTQNALDLAGVMALSNGLKANEIMRCLDLNIPPGDEEMARMCREILNWCIRNTEKADARARSEGSFRGLKVWGMIEGSALARDVRKEESTRPRVQSESETILTAQSIKAEIERALQTPSGKSPSLDPPTGRQPTIDITLLEQARSVLPALAAMIQASNNPHRLEEMLLLNDALTELINKAQRLGEKPVRLALVTNGHANGRFGFSDLDKRTASPLPSVSSAPPVLLIPRGVPEPEDDDTPTTPRVDKGKGKAVDLPPGVNSDHEEHGKIIPEPGSLADVTVEDGELVPLNPGSPTDTRSRIWVEEEGEVFRKGVALLTQEKMEGELGDFAGDDLRIELLETPVERPPARILDMDIDGNPIMENEPPMSPPVPRSPRGER